MPFFTSNKKIQEQIKKQVEQQLKKVSSQFRSIGNNGNINSTTFNSYEDQFSPERKKDLLAVYLKYIWVYASVYAIASNCAKVPLKIYEGTSLNDKGEEVTSGNLYDLFQNPNPNQSYYDWIEAYISSAELTGDAFAEINEDQTQLYVLRPDLVKIIASSTALVDYYTYTVNGNIITFAPEEIFHFKYYNPLSELYGTSPGTSVEHAMILDFYSLKYQKNFFKNGALLDRYVSVPESLSDPDYKRMKEDFSIQHKGVENSHLLGVLDNGAEIKEIGIEPEKVLLKESRMLNREEILAAYGVPPIMVGITDTTSYNNAGVQERSFYKNTLMPKLTKLQSRLNTKFFIPEGMICEFDYSDIPALQEDKEKQSKTLTVYVEKGVLTPNEAREKIGYPEIEGGDKLKTPTSGFSPADFSKFIKAAYSTNITKAKVSENKKESALKTFNKQMNTSEDKINPLTDKYFTTQEKIINSFVKANYNLVEKAVIDVDFVERAIKGLDKSTQKYLKDLSEINSSVTIDFAEEELLRLTDRSLNSKVSKEIVTNTKNWTVKSVNEISKTTSTNLIALFKKSYKENFTVDDVQKKVSELFTGTTRGSFPRSRMIARTESLRNTNYGKKVAFKDANIKKKEWIWSGTERDEHSEFEAQGVKPMNYIYSSESGNIQFPGQAGASAEHVINCGCTWIEAE